MYKGTLCRVEKKQHDSYKYVDATTYAVYSAKDLRVKIDASIAEAELMVRELQALRDVLERDVSPQTGVRSVVKPTKVPRGATGRTEKRGP